jgi:hypothetical protein
VTDLNIMPPGSPAGELADGFSSSGANRQRGIAAGPSSLPKLSREIKVACRRRVEAVRVLKVRTALARGTAIG